MAVSQHNPMARLRRAALPGLVAILAIVLQCLVLADHVAAQASKASLGGGAPGVLRLCVNSSDAGQSGEAPCPVCVSAACQTTLHAPSPPSAPAPPPRAARAEWRPVVAVSAPGCARVGSARGPPALSV